MEKDSNSKILTEKDVTEWKKKIYFEIKKNKFMDKEEDYILSLYQETLFLSDKLNKKESRSSLGPETSDINSDTLIGLLKFQLNEIIKCEMPEGLRKNLISILKEIEEKFDDQFPNFFIFNLATDLLCRRIEEITKCLQEDDSKKVLNYLNERLITNELKFHDLWKEEETEREQFKKFSKNSDLKMKEYIIKKSNQILEQSWEMKKDNNMILNLASKNKNLNSILKNINDKFEMQDTEMKKMIIKSQSHDDKIQSLNDTIKIQETEIKKMNTKINSQDFKIQSLNDKIKIQNNSIKYQNKNYQNKCDDIDEMRVEMRKLKIDNEILKNDFNKAVKKSNNLENSKNILTYREIIRFIIKIFRDFFPDIQKEFEIVDGLRNNQYNPDNTLADILNELIKIKADYNLIVHPKLSLSINSFFEDLPNFSSNYVKLTDWNFQGLIKAIFKSDKIEINKDKIINKDEIKKEIETIFNIKLE